MARFPTSPVRLAWLAGRPPLDAPEDSPASSTMGSPSECSSSNTMGTVLPVFDQGLDQILRCSFKDMRKVDRQSTVLLLPLLLQLHRLSQSDCPSSSCSCSAPPPPTSHSALTRCRSESLAVAAASEKGEGCSGAAPPSAAALTGPLLLPEGEAECWASDAFCRRDTAVAAEP